MLRSRCLAHLRQAQNLNCRVSVLCATTETRTQLRELASQLYQVDADEPEALPVELAAFISQRNLGIVALPSELEAALSIAGPLNGAGSLKGTRRHGQHLLSQLRLQSRSKARGGLQELSSLSPDEALRKKIKPHKAASALQKALSAFRKGPAFSVTPDNSDHPAGLADLQTALDEAQAAQPSVQMYDQDGAAAGYNLMRMPACYAAAFRVLRELRLVRPQMQPTSLLDFGAGPGTAIWAAQQVWPNMLQNISAIESSKTMARMGQSIQLQLEHVYPAAVRWHHSLSAPSFHRQNARQRRHRRGSLGKQHDLVIAAYVLCEMDPREHAQAVAALWHQASAALVLIEPGTPSGSATVRAARQQVLESAGAGGAHVVSPCPHEGRCPMDGTRSWCHFGQRFTRTRVQAAAKVLPGGHAARNYQDERFSYVILAKGPRAFVSSEIANAPISPFLVDDPRLQSKDAQSRGHGDLTATEIFLNAESQTSQTREPGGQSSATVRQQTAAELDLDSAVRQLMVDSINLGEDSDEDRISTAALQSLLAENAQVDPPGQDGHVQPNPQASCTSQNEPAAAVVRSSPAFGSGSHALKPGDLSIADRDADEDTASLDACRYEDLQPDSSIVGLTEPQPAARSSAVACSHQPVQRSSFADFAPASEAGEDDSGTQELDEDSNLSTDEHWRTHHAEELARAAAASTAWSRIIRKPRKRQRHVLIDICSAEPADGERRGPGRLIRQAVGFVDRQHWLGPAGYRTVRKAQWGDVWPGFYEQHAIEQHGQN